MTAEKVCPVCNFLTGDGEFCPECGWLMSQEFQGTADKSEIDLHSILGYRPFIVLPGRGAYVLNRARTVVGREFGDILLREDLNISRIHFALLAETGNLYLEDMGSSNGTFLNGVRIQPQKRYPLSDGDIVQAGDSKIKIEFKGQADTDSRAGTFLTSDADFNHRLRRGENTIGRLPTNNIRIDDDPYLAREHASIFIEESPAGDDFIYVMDKHSSNGTFINDKKIAPGARIRVQPGDRLKLGLKEYKIVSGK